MVVRESADPKARVPVNWRSVSVCSNDSTAEFKLKTELLGCLDLDLFRSRGYKANSEGPNETAPKCKTISKANGCRQNLRILPGGCSESKPKASQLVVAHTWRLPGASYHS